MTRLAIVMLAVLAFSCGADETTPGAASGGGAGAGGSGATGGAPSGGSGGTASGGTGGTTSGGSAGTSGKGGGGGGPDSLAQAKGIEVAEVDLDGFPSYTVDGCTLAYVSAKSKELVVRDLATGSETSVESAAAVPRRPSLAGDVLAWETGAAGSTAVRIRHAGVTTTLSGSFVQAGEPRATTDAVVFTGWLGGTADSDTDVFLYKLSDQSTQLVSGGKGQQRFADVSLTHVALSDFSEDPSGIYSGDGTTLADVIVVDRATNTATLRSASGKQAFPMLGSSGTLSYLEWVGVHPVPKLQEYAIWAVPLASPTATGTKLTEVQSEQAVRPTARAGVAEWVVRWEGKSTLFRAAVDGSSGPQKQELGSVAVLHAPSSSSSMTVLAVRQTTASAPALAAIPR